MSKARAERLLARIEAVCAVDVALRAADAVLRHSVGDSVQIAGGRDVMQRVLDRIGEGIADVDAEMAGLRAALLDEMGMECDHEQ